jgi:hypothetical protein
MEINMDAFQKTKNRADGVAQVVACPANEA